LSLFFVHLLVCPARFFFRASLLIIFINIYTNVCPSLRHEENSALGDIISLSFLRFVCCFLSLSLMKHPRVSLFLFFLHSLGCSAFFLAGGKHSFHASPESEQIFFFFLFLLLFCASAELRIPPPGSGRLHFFFAGSPPCSFRGPF